MRSHHFPAAPKNVDSLANSILVKHSKDSGHIVPHIDNVAFFKTKRLQEGLAVKCSIMFSRIETLRNTEHTFHSTIGLSERNSHFK